MAGLSTKYNYDAYLQHRNEQNQNQQNQGQGVVNVQQPANTGNNPAVATQQPTQVAPSAQQSQNNVGEKSLVMKPTVQDGAPNANATADNAATTGEMKSKLAIAQHFGRRMPEITAETAPSEAAYTAYERSVTPQPQEENRKHGWRDWFKKTDDEEYENRKRERIAAFSDMIRHLANLHYVNQYATPQHIESAYGKVKAEEREQRKLKQERENEDRKWNWKVSEAQRDQYNKDRAHGLGVRKDQRAEALQPDKAAKAKAEKEYAEEKARIQKAVGEGKISEQEAKTKTQEAKAKYAGALEQSKIDKNKATANKENAHAGVYNRTAPNGSGGRKGGSGGGKTTQYNHSDSNYVWDVPVSSQSQLNSNLRAIVTKEKNSKWVEDYKRRTDKMTLSEGDYDRIAREHIGDPEIQRAISKTGAKARKVEKKKSKTQL